jgi:hypothetical protein
LKSPARFQNRNFTSEHVDREFHAPPRSRLSSSREPDILRLADQQQARILFSGDARQIQSVEASDALRILERESQMKSVSLTGVQRQTHAECRDAIQTLRQAPEQGFKTALCMKFHTSNAPALLPIFTVK